MTNLIRELRDLIPIRPLRFAEALRVAEIQAAKMLLLCGVEEAPVRETIITELPKLQVERIYPLGASGFSQWAKGRWLIALNNGEPPTRQRFSLAHEFKHVLDHPFIKVLYPPEYGLSESQRREQACDHFAACLLMPRPWLKRAWGNGAQDVDRLAVLFDVSKSAMDRRLQQIGLTERRTTRHGAAA